MTRKHRWSVLLLAAALSLPAAGGAAPKDQPKVKEKQGNIYRGNAQWKRDARRDESYYRNRYGRYGYRSNGQQEHLDGFVVDDRGECVLFREHRTGQIFALAGNIGDMREGDHIRYVGTHTYDEYCGGGYPTMNVREIKTLWSNDRHDSAVFDANRDGSYSRWADRYYDSRYRDRYGDDRYDRYDDDYRYDDRYYDRDGDRRLVTVEGRLDDGRYCPSVRGNNGELYNLSGNLKNFREGDRVKVFGYLAEDSRCGGRTLQVSEIVKR
ncbi:MAG TPA: hypothetical protein VF789_20515 [Thermoanaerobaculia bacterium]